MEDTLLIDAAERFVNGEMSPEERVYFEDLRKNNPELDQAVVEQIFFLNQLGTYSSSKNFKSVLNDVEQKLVTEKFMQRNAPQSKGRVVMFWERYRKTIAVAASIAGVVSLFIATLVTSVTKTDTPNIKPLIEILNDTKKKTTVLENKVNRLEADAAETPVQPKLESNFRATGFMIDAANNYIVTNAHVIKEASHHLIVENNKGDQYYATAVYVNQANDIAVIRITDTSFKQLPGLPYNVRRNGAELGEPIFMLGFPKQEIVYGEGYISAKNGYLMDTVFCQITSAANEGNSGSPVITKTGDVVGIVSSMETNANGVVFAIKSANIYRAVEEVKKLKDNGNIKINASPSLKGLDRVSQVRKTEDYVFMIKGN